VIPLLGIYPKEHKTGYNRDTCKCLFWKIEPKDKHIHKKQTHPYTNSYMEHVYQGGTTLELGERGKGKQMIRHQQYHKT
jgi:hypothetical protein